MSSPRHLMARGTPVGSGLLIWSWPESPVRKWLRNHQARADCSECIARGLKRDAGLIRAVMSKLVFAQHAYWAQHSDCGKRGFKQGR